MTAVRHDDFRVQERGRPDAQRRRQHPAPSSFLRKRSKEKVDSPSHSFVKFFARLGHDGDVHASERFTRDASYQCLNTQR